MRQTRVRPAIALPIGVAVAIALGYAYSYEPDEEAAYQRAAAAQEARRREIGEREYQARAATRDSVLAARAQADSIRFQERFMACGRTMVSMTSRCLRFMIDSVMYTVELEPSGRDDGNGVQAIRLHQGLRVLYKEDLGEIMAPGAWMDVSVRLLDDPDGRPRAFLFEYTYYGQNTEVSYRILPVRPGAVLLTPRFTYAGLEGTSAGSFTGSLRLLMGNLIVTWAASTPVSALIPHHVDAGCESGGFPCVTIVRDSTTGRATLGAYVDGIGLVVGEEEADAESALDGPSATIEMFADPAAKASERVRVKYGHILDVVEGRGARRLEDTRYAVYEQPMRDGWLRIRVDRRTGWVRGAEAFAALYHLPIDSLPHIRPSRQ